MAALADQHAAAAAGRVGVVDRVRAAVRLFAVDPEDLPAGLLEDLPLLLDGRGVDPVLGVQQPALGSAARRPAIRSTLARAASRAACLSARSQWKSWRAVAEIAGQRLLADRRTCRAAARPRRSARGPSAARRRGSRRPRPAGRRDGRRSGCRVSALGGAARFVERVARRPPQRSCRRLSAAPRNGTRPKSRSRRFPREWFFCS